MTKMYLHVLAVIGPFSSTYSNTEFGGVLYLSCSMYFFSKYSGSLLLLFDKIFRYLILYYALEEYSLFLQNDGLFYLPVKSFIRKPASTRNDHVKNPKSKDLGFAIVMSTIFFSISLSNLCCL